MKVAKFEANYDRFGTIEVVTGKCDSCQHIEDKACIAIDSSEDEYGPGLICQDCAYRAFSQYSHLTKEEKAKEKD